MTLAGERLRRLDAAVKEFLAQAALGKPPELESFLARHEDVRSALEPLVRGYMQVSTEPSVGGTPPRNEFLPLRVGQRIGRYELLEEVGRGGMGVVWKAKDDALDAVVALKFLPGVLASDPLALRALREEARVLLSLTHLHIVRLRTLEAEGSYAFLVMEYLAGPTLLQFIHERTLATGKGLSAREALWVIEQVGQALDFAHREGVTHRDLKPANLMLDRPHTGVLEGPSPRVKLTDFGLAFVANSTVSQKTGYRPSGTLPFMAPEVLMGGKPTRRADIYSLAATVHALIRGEPPFATGDVVTQILHREAPPLASGDRSLDAAVAAGLSKSPSERPVDVPRFLALARGEISASQATVDTEDLGESSAPRRHRRRIAAGIGAAVALTAAGGWWSLHSQDDARAESPALAAISGIPAPKPVRIELDEPAVLPGGTVFVREEEFEIAGHVEGDRSTDIVDVDLDSQVHPHRIDASGRFTAKHHLVGERTEVRLSLPGGDHSLAFWIVRDAVDPLIEIVDPTDGLRTNSRALRLAVVATDAHLTQVVVGERVFARAIDGTWLLNGQPSDGSWTAFDNDQATRIEIGAMDFQEEGEHAVSVTAQDRAGNTSRATVRVVVDTVPPAVNTVVARKHGSSKENTPLAPGSDIEIELGFDEELRELTIGDAAAMLDVDPRLGHAQLRGPDVPGPWRPTWTARDLTGNIAQGQLDLVLSTGAKSPPDGFEVVDWTAGSQAWPRRIREPKTGIELVLVEPGRFSMGTWGREGEEDERPQRALTIERPFYLSCDEITVGQWRAFASTAGYRTQAEVEGKSWVHAERGQQNEVLGATWEAPQAGLQVVDQHPAVHVSWNDAGAFCRHFGFRLPTEMEWEYACRMARGSLAYPWGDRPEYGRGAANVLGSESRGMAPADAKTFPFEDGIPGLARVDATTPNAWGFRNLIGNVWEWCADAYDEHAVEAPIDVDALPARDRWRVLRGGSWLSGPADARCARRAFEFPDMRSDAIGFRVVLDPEPAKKEPVAQSGKRLYPVMRSASRGPLGMLRLDGDYELSWPGGKFAVKGRYEGGLRAKRWVFRRPSGQESASGRFNRDGLEDGEWTITPEDGKPQRVVYTAGVWEGPTSHWTRFYWGDGATLRAEGRIDQGLPVGPWTFWWPNGQRQVQGEYVRGRAQGAWSFWHSDGTPDEWMISGRYEKGERKHLLAEHAWNPPAELAGVVQPPVPPISPTRRPAPESAEPTTQDERAAIQIRLREFLDQPGSRVEALHEEVFNQKNWRKALPVALEQLQKVDLTSLRSVQDGQRLVVEVLPGLNPSGRGSPRGLFPWVAETSPAAQQWNARTILAWSSLWNLTAQEAGFWSVDAYFAEPMPAYANLEIWPPDAEILLREMQLANPLLRPPFGVEQAAIRAQLGTEGPTPAPGRAKRAVKADPASRGIVDGLRWLARHQNQDGSWSPTTLRDQCGCGDPAYNPKSAYSPAADVGLTAMAVLCFLGEGLDVGYAGDLVDVSMAKRHRPGIEIVPKALVWLIRSQGADGEFGWYSAPSEPAGRPEAAKDDRSLRPSLGTCPLCAGVGRFKSPAGETRCPNCAGTGSVPDPSGGSTDRPVPLPIPVQPGIPGQRGQVLPAAVGNPRIENQALATMALIVASEAGSVSTRGAAQRGINFLTAAQKPSPTGQGMWGWGYTPRQEVEFRNRGAQGNQAKELFDANTVCTAFAALALGLGRERGFEVPQESLEGAAAFLNFVTQSGGDGKPTGLVGLLDARSAGAKVTGPYDHFIYHPAALTALGAWVRIITSRTPDDPFARTAAEQFVRDLPAISKDKLSIDHSYWFFATLALSHIDGQDSPKRTSKYWGPWKKALDATLDLQNHSERACTNGGWMDLDRWSYVQGGPLCTTTLAILTLQVANGTCALSAAFPGRR